MILLHPYQRNIVLVVLVPRHSLQRLVCLKQNITSTQIPRIKFPCRTVRAYRCKDVGVRGKAYIEHLLIMRDLLLYRSTFGDVPD